MKLFFEDTEISNQWKSLSDDCVKKLQSEIKERLKTVIDNDCNINRYDGRLILPTKKDIFDDLYFTTTCDGRKVRIVAYSSNDDILIRIDRLSD